MPISEVFFCYFGTHGERYRYHLIIFQHIPQQRMQSYRNNEGFRFFDPPLQTVIYTPVDWHSSGKRTLWRCSSYTKWERFIAISIYQRASRGGHLESSGPRNIGDLKCKHERKWNRDLDWSLLSDLKTWRPKNGWSALTFHRKDSVLAHHCPKTSKV